MKPTVLKRKDSRGRITGYVAHIFSVDSPLCATAVEASAACERETLAALHRLDRGTRIFKWQGHTVVVAPTIEGWSYWIDTSTRTDFDSHVAGSATREDAENAALSHLAQNVWEPVFDDVSFLATLPPSVASELAPWIRFQRSYATLRAAGKSDAEAHREAVR
jgi:hypothetical protein